MPKATPSFVFKKQYPYWRSAEGPKIRAARLRREAKARGKTTYNTGQPCRYGHYADRFVCNGKCRECNRQDSEQANRLGLYRLKTHQPPQRVDLMSEAKSALDPLAARLGPHVRALVQATLYSIISEPRQPATGSVTRDRHLGLPTCRV